MYSFTLKSVDFDAQRFIRDHGLAQNGQVQQFVDSEVLRYCEPYIPMDQHILIDSGIQNTTIGSGEVKWRTPYARRWYYMPANFSGAPMRGNYWFERMKKAGGLERILKGAARLMGG